jgi:hypothetical protein
MKVLKAICNNFYPYYHILLCFSTLGDNFNSFPLMHIANEILQ